MWHNDLTSYKIVLRASTAYSMLRLDSPYDITAVRNTELPQVKTSFHAQVVANLLWALHQVCSHWTETEFAILGNKLFLSMRTVRLKMLRCSLINADLQDKVCFHIGAVLDVVTKCWQKINMKKRKRTLSNVSDLDWMKIRNAKRHFESILILDPEDPTLVCTRVAINARDAAFLALAIVQFCFGEIKGHGSICNLQHLWLHACDYEDNKMSLETSQRILLILSRLPSQLCNEDPCCIYSKILKHWLLAKYELLEEMQTLYIRSCSQIIAKTNASARAKQQHQARLCSKRILIR